MYSPELSIIPERLNMAENFLKFLKNYTYSDALINTLKHKTQV